MCLFWFDLSFCQKYWCEIEFDENIKNAHVSIKFHIAQLFNSLIFIFNNLWHFNSLILLFAILYVQFSLICLPTDLTDSFTNVNKLHQCKRQKQTRTWRVRAACGRGVAQFITIIFIVIFKLTGSITNRLYFS